MAIEAQAHVGEANSINVVKDNGNITVEDSEGLNATEAKEAKEAMLDNIKNEEIEQVKSSESYMTDVTEIPENTKVESGSGTLIPEIEADVKEVKDQINEINIVELQNGLADAPAEISIPELHQELKSEAAKESTFTESAVEEVKRTEEPSPVEVYENIPEIVSNEAATSDATAQEVKTTEITNIEESTPLVSFQNVPESAAKELSLLESTVAEKEATGALLTDSSQAEEISENVPEPSPTKTREDTQVTNLSATEEVQNNLSESSVSGSSVSTTEKKETLITELSTLMVTENVLETAVPETRVEVPIIPEESVSIVMNADTTVQAYDVISKASLGDAKKVEEKKENSLGKLFMLENVVAEEPKIITTTETVCDVEKASEKTTLVESSRDDVEYMISEKIGKDTEKTEESSEVSKAEVQVKSSNQKSNSILTKMKQSIVKAKKAIVGKLPSSKAMDMESKDDIKL